jgi:hypothetical protein
MPFMTPSEGSCGVVDGDAASVEVGKDEIGKRAADIDANDLHGL